MIKTVIICDRCGAIIDDPKHMPKWKISGTATTDDKMQRVDYCRPCKRRREYELSGATGWPP